MTNSMKKKKRELLKKVCWTTRDIMEYFDYSKTKASTLIMKLREDDNNIPELYRGNKRPPIITQNVLVALGTNKELEMEKLK